LSSSHKF